LSNECEASLTYVARDVTGATTGRGPLLERTAARTPAPSRQPTSKRQICSTLLLDEIDELDLSVQSKLRDCAHLAYLAEAVLCLLQSLL